MLRISLSVIFFKFRQYKNVNIANFVYYGKTCVNEESAPHAGATFVQSIRLGTKVMQVNIFYETLKVFSE